MPKLIDGTDVLVVDGKEYKRGDNVPLSQALADHHRDHAGLRFEGDPDPVSTAPVFEARPTDDRGAPIESKGKKSGE